MVKLGMNQNYVLITRKCLVLDKYDFMFLLRYLASKLRKYKSSYPKC